MSKLDPEALAEMQEDFAFNDADGDGRITFEEFCDLLEDLEAEVSPEESLLGFHEIDTNGNGSISFDEFVAWWKGIG